MKATSDLTYKILRDVLNPATSPEIRSYLQSLLESIPSRRCETEKQKEAKLAKEAKAAAKQAAKEAKSVEKTAKKVRKIIRLVRPIADLITDVPHT